MDPTIVNLEKIKIKELFTFLEKENKLMCIRPKVKTIMPDTPVEPNNKIAMEIFGPLPLIQKGSEYYFDDSGCFNKILAFYFDEIVQAESMINELFDHYIYIFSSPKHSSTDQGSNIVRELI